MILRKLTVLLAALLLHMAAAEAADVSLHAADSLRSIGDSFARTFKRETGLELEITYAGDDALARQLRRNVPADVIVTDNADWMDHLEDGNAIRGATRRVLAGNRLALIARTDDDTAARSLADLSTHTSQRLLALGDPRRTAVGELARQSLRELGIWDAISDRAIQTGSSRAALAFLRRGSAHHAIAYRTDALAFETLRLVELLPEETHDPVRYEAALTFQGSALNGDNARALLDALFNARTADLLAEAGFIPCAAGGCGS